MFLHRLVGRFFERFFGRFFGRFVWIFLFAFVAGMVGGVPLSGSAALAHGGSSGGEEKGKADFGAGPYFVQVNPMQIPIVQGGKVIQLLVLSVVLELEKGEDIERVKAYAPLVRDGYLSSLYGALHVRGQGGDLIDIDLVRAKIKETNDKVIPDIAVKNILLQELQQRKP